MECVSWCEKSGENRNYRQKKLHIFNFCVNRIIKGNQWTADSSSHPTLFFFQSSNPDPAINCHPVTRMFLLHVCPSGYFKSHIGRRHVLQIKFPSCFSFYYRPHHVMITGLNPDSQRAGKTTQCLSSPNPNESIY